MSSYFKSKHAYTRHFNREVILLFYKQMEKITEIPLHCRITSLGIKQRENSPTKGRMVFLGSQLINVQKIMYIRMRELVTAVCFSFFLIIHDIQNQISKTW